MSFSENLVLVGGGHAISLFARHLQAEGATNVTTIHSVFDHGGHTGQMRDATDVFAYGDIREALTQRATANLRLKELLETRSGKNGSGVSTSYGNLMIAALHKQRGGKKEDFPKVIAELAKELGIPGQVLPVSLDSADVKCLMARNGGGEVSLLNDEGQLDQLTFDDERLILGAYLKPSAMIYPGAARAVERGDMVVFGGSLFGSIVPNFLVDGFPKAMHKSKALVIYPMNIMSEPQTKGYSGIDYLKVICHYLKRKIDVVICNIGPISEDTIAAYYRQGAHEVVGAGLEGYEEYADHVEYGEIVEEVGNKVVHGPKLAQMILDLRAPA